MTSDLREALAAISTAGSGKCPMARLLDELDKKDKKTRLIVEEKLFDPAFPYTRLHKELRRAGFRIGIESVGSHRNGICICRSN